MWSLTQVVRLRNTQAPAMAACSSSRPVGASSSMPVIAPQEMLVASPSFAFDLNRSDRRGFLGNLLDLVPRYSGYRRSIRVSGWSVVQYKVVESDYRKFLGKYTEFGNGCTWYNGPYTYLATSISSDHRSLDYHVISAFIVAMVRADTASNCNGPTNLTTCLFAKRHIYRYNHERAADPQLYPPMSSSLATYGSHLM
ncbi:hypothetical protein Ahy_B01g053489 [Arachis hypogaea]|uniref:Uncharacterized protein n=1 Tax=Arachis hypogaea TaxID=3818 RepID=A0A445AS04_ARAHY|nr:hypothetical protein Ahy_B01g053489 [Arachis hypogaea]